MPLHRTFRHERNRSRRLERSVFWLGMLLITSWPILGGMLVNASEALAPPQSGADSVNVISSGVDGATRALDADTVLLSSTNTSEPQRGEILQEMGKQTIDQPGHFLIGAAPIWASRYLVGVPWYGWVVAPLLAYREWLQWPSKRWWDPPMDWAFLSLGAVVATCRRRWTHRLLHGLLPRRRRIAR